MSRRQHDEVSQILTKTLMDHPSELQLCQYVDELLGGNALALIKRHLSRCPDCKEKVEMLTAPCEPIASSIEGIDPETRERIETLVRNHA